LAGVNTAGTM